MKLAKLWRNNCENKSGLLDSLCNTAIPPDLPSFTIIMYSVHFQFTFTDNRGKPIGACPIGHSPTQFQGGWGAAVLNRLSWGQCYTKDYKFTIFGYTKDILLLVIPKISLVIHKHILPALLCPIYAGRYEARCALN